jgi:hypothetical protein
MLQIILPYVLLSAMPKLKRSKFPDFDSRMLPRIQQMYDQGKSVSEICSTLSIHKATLLKATKHLGLLFCNRQYYESTKKIREEAIPERRDINTAFCKFGKLNPFLAAETHHLLAPHFTTYRGAKYYKGKLLIMQVWFEAIRDLNTIYKERGEKQLDYCQDWVV